MGREAAAAVLNEIARSVDDRRNHRSLDVRSALFVVVPVEEAPEEEEVERSLVVHSPAVVGPEQRHSSHMSGQTSSDLVAVIEVPSSRSCQMRSDSEEVKLARAFVHIGKDCTLAANTCFAAADSNSRDNCSSLVAATLVLDTDPGSWFADISGPDLVGTAVPALDGKMLFAGK